MSSFSRKIFINYRSIWLLFNTASGLFCKNKSSQKFMKDQIRENKSSRNANFLSLRKFVDLRYNFFQKDLKDKKTDFWNYLRFFISVTFFFRLYVLIIYCVCCIIRENLSLVHENFFACILWITLKYFKDY